MSHATCRSAAALCICLLCAAGCGHSGLPPAKVKPGWIPNPNRSHPDLIYVTGSCRGIRRRELARRCAIGDAKMQIRKALRRDALPFQSSYVKDEHYEAHRGTAGGPSRFDWWVLVAYPRRGAAAPAATGAASGAASAPASASASAEERQLLAKWRKLDQRSRGALLTIIDAMSGSSRADLARRLLERCRRAR